MKLKIPPKIDFSQFTVALVRHTPSLSSNLLSCYLCTIYNNLYPTNPAPYTKQTPLMTFVGLQLATCLPRLLPNPPTPSPRRLKSPCTTPTIPLAWSSTFGGWISPREGLILSLLPFLLNQLLLRHRPARESLSLSLLRHLPLALVLTTASWGAWTSAAASASSRATAASSARGRTGPRTRSNVS